MDFLLLTGSSNFSIKDHVQFLMLPSIARIASCRHFVLECSVIGCGKFCFLNLPKGQINSAETSFLYYYLSIFGNSSFREYEMII